MSERKRLRLDRALYGASYEMTDGTRVDPSTVSTSEQIWARMNDNIHAAKLLVYRFGEREGLYLLWNETCFPMDGATALAQARALIDQRRGA
jgi:hypothetical protein